MVVQPLAFLHYHRFIRFTRIRYYPLAIPGSNIDDIKHIIFIILDIHDSKVRLYLLVESLVGVAYRNILGRTCYCARCTYIA